MYEELHRAVQASREPRCPLQEGEVFADGSVTVTVCACLPSAIKSAFTVAKPRCIADAMQVRTLPARRVAVGHGKCSA